MKQKGKLIQVIDNLKVLEPRFVEVLIVIHATVPMAQNSQKRTSDPQKWQMTEYKLTSMIRVQHSKNFSATKEESFFNHKTPAQENENRGQTDSAKYRDVLIQQQ
jgi:hypothetical protein